jgi:light-harvesting complex I chlorophyll a/b binding protein 1
MSLLAEPLSMGQDTISRGSGKAFLVIPFLFGFVFAVFFSPVLFTRSEVQEPAINMVASPQTMTCLRAPAMSVNAMQSVLRKNGVPSSPMEKFALTSFAATRDVTMRAQVKEEFSKLDHETQAKLKKLSKELVVKATSRGFSAEDMPGVSAPLGFWDPAGFAKDEESFTKYRQAEIKHGRVCMSSSLGMLVADKFHPIFDNWNEGPFVSSMASHFSETATKNFWPAFWIMTAGHELATTLQDYDGKEEFDYGFDPLNLRPEDPEKELEYKTMELNHGRWAMFCAAGIIAQELVTGKAVI